MKLKFNGFLVLLLVLVAQITFAQERTVSGIVSDNAGLPLPGVSVLVKGTKTEKAIGKGEAAGIALTKTYGGILASNNCKDIALYIEKYNLKHIDTGRILIEGLEKALITEEQGNTVWEQMPCNDSVVGSTQCPRCRNKLLFLQGHNLSTYNTRHTNPI